MRKLSGKNEVYKMTNKEDKIIIDKDLDLTPPPELVEHARKVEESIKPTKADLDRKWK
jgi:hypothetical protein